MSNVVEYTTVKFLGTSDEVFECECCGKKNLKSTVAVSFDDNEPVYYGVVCAARALQMDGKAVKAATKSADEENRAAEHAAKMKIENDKRVQWFAWLEKNGTGADPFSQIQSLGGHAAAKALYKSST